MHFTTFKFAALSFGRTNIASFFPPKQILHHCISSHCASTTTKCANPGSDKHERQCEHHLYIIQIFFLRLYMGIRNCARDIKKETNKHVNIFNSKVIKT